MDKLESHLYCTLTHLVKDSPKIFGKCNANITSQLRSHVDSNTKYAATETIPKAQAPKFVPYQPLQATIQKIWPHNLKVNRNLTKPMTTRTFSPYQQPQFLARNTSNPRKSTSKSWKTYEPTLREFVPSQPLLVMPQIAMPYRPYMVTMLPLQPLQKLTEETPPSGPFMPETLTENWSIPVHAATESQKNNQHYYGNITSQLVPPVSVTHSTPKSEFVTPTLQTTFLETPSCSRRRTGNLLKQANSQAMNQQPKSCENYGNFYYTVTFPPFSPYLFTQPLQKMLEEEDKTSPLPATTQVVTPYRPMMAAAQTPLIQPVLQTTPPCSPNMTETLLKRKAAQLASAHQQSRTVTYPQLKIMKLDVETSDDVTRRAKPYRPLMVAQRSAQTQQSRFAGKTLPTTTQEKLPSSSHMTNHLLISQTAGGTFSQNSSSQFSVAKSSIETNLNQISRKNYRQYQANITTQSLSPYSFTQTSQVLEQSTEMSRFTSLQSGRQ
ncbi:unnamed protein product [Ceratitis capitata]|uniref:(Mediterranean fruit fly) hypothetical protein n=1 Tax=Ceratitis capitata TaxID=7213 RepID=A0A811UJ85_CERCA|nr:unnamed protein product [Ceratitis capitata]